MALSYTEPNMSSVQTACILQKMALSYTEPNMSSVQMPPRSLMAADVLRRRGPANGLVLPLPPPPDQREGLMARTRRPWPHTGLRRAFVEPQRPHDGSSDLLDDCEFDLDVEVANTFLSS
ncbi:unnamed protein product [Arctogadus glacialis]